MPHPRQHGLDCTLKQVFGASSHSFRMSAGIVRNHDHADVHVDQFGRSRWSPCELIDSMQSELDVREFRMNVMPIAEILNEIDACLSRLREARELLLDQQMKAPPKKVTHVQRKVTPGQPDPASSHSHRADKNKSRS